MSRHIEIMSRQSKKCLDIFSDVHVYFCRDKVFLVKSKVRTTLSRHSYVFLQNLHNYLFQPINTNDIMQYSPSTHFILVKTHIIIKQSLFKYKQQISFFTQYHSSRYSQCIQAMSKMKLYTNFMLGNKLQLYIIIKEQVREKEELPLVILLHSDF